MVQKLNFPGSDKTIVGITGIFGSGKTTAAHFFEELGAKAIDADKLGHEALMAGSPVYEKIRPLFKEAESPDGKELDHKKMSDIVFANPERRKELESIIHPYVFDRILEEIIDAQESVIVVDVPLLYEAGYDAYCHHVVVVNAAADVITKRLREKGFSEEEILKRQGAQMPLEEKVKKADFIINNQNTFQQTRQEVEKIWKKLHSAQKGAV